MSHRTASLEGRERGDESSGLFMGFSMRQGWLFTLENLAIQFDRESGTEIDKLLLKRAVLGNPQDLHKRLTRASIQ